MFVVKCNLRTHTHSPQYPLHSVPIRCVLSSFFPAVFPHVYFCFTNLNIARYILVGILSRAHKYAERNTFHNQMSTINVKEIVSSSVSASSNHCLHILCLFARSLRSFTLKTRNTHFLLCKRSSRLGILA